MKSFPYCIEMHRVGAEGEWSNESSIESSLRHLADTGQDSLGMPGAVHSVVVYCAFTEKQCAFTLVPTA